MTQRLEVTALTDIGEVESGMDVGSIACAALAKSGISLEKSSVIVIAQKIVSKAEGRLVALDTITPSDRALELSAITGKNPAFVEAVLKESTEVLRAQYNVLIVRHRLGFVVANAGIDQSNVHDAGGRPVCLLLPEDPTASAVRIRDRIVELTGFAAGVIVSDSFGRPWRRGVINVALGSAGLPALVDRRGCLDRFGKALEVTEVALGDALAAAAGIVMGEADEGTPIVVITGGDWSAPNVDAVKLIRPITEDLFH